MKIIQRIKQCSHLCCFCKYSTICDISWWKRERVMANCVTCKADCANKGQHRVITSCISHVPNGYSKPVTNFDLIRCMTVENLAEFLTPAKCVDCHLIDCDAYDIENHKTCTERILDWLKAENNE